MQPGHESTSVNRLDPFRLNEPRSRLRMRTFFKKLGSVAFKILVLTVPALLEKRLNQSLGGESAVEVYAYGHSLVADAIKTWLISDSD